MNLSKSLGQYQAHTKSSKCHYIIFISSIEDTFHLTPLLGAVTSPFPSLIPVTRPVPNSSPLMAPYYLLTYNKMRQLGVWGLPLLLPKMLPLSFPAWSIPIHLSRPRFHDASYKKPSEIPASLVGPLASTTLQHSSNTTIYYMLVFVHLAATKFFCLFPIITSIARLYCMCTKCSMMKYACYLSQSLWKTWKSLSTLYRWSLESFITSQSYTASRWQSLDLESWHRAVILTPMQHSCLASFVFPPAQTQNKCAAEHFGQCWVIKKVTTLIIISYQFIWVLIICQHLPKHFTSINQSSQQPQEVGKKFNPIL